MSPAVSGDGFDRGRPRRAGRRRSVIRKLRVIRGLLSGRTERSAMAFVAMGRNRRAQFRAREARERAKIQSVSGRGSLCRRTLSDCRMHNRTAGWTLAKDANRPPVPHGERAISARPITGRGCRQGVPRHPGWHSVPGLRVTNPTTNRSDPGQHTNRTWYLVRLEYYDPARSAQPGVRTPGPEKTSLLPFRP